MEATLAVGFFDGVHLGHRAILSGADEVFTFLNHPLTVLSPERAPRLIMSVGDRLAAIRACGVKKVTAVEFTRSFADRSPEDFAAAYLKGRRIRCGANWRFGKRGRGDAAFLRSHGYDVSVVPAVSLDVASAADPAIVSSTRIRAALEAGRIEEANAMLGRPFEVRGRPFRGKGEGRSLGYPTVNLLLEGFSLDLPFGVYAVEVSGCRGLANYGCAPTFGARAWKEPVMEVHYVSEMPSVSGASDPVAVRFSRFLRPERKFETLEELKAQIKRDVCVVLMRWPYVANPARLRLGTVF